MQQSQQAALPTCMGVGITVADAERTAAFYKGVLGFSGDPPLLRLGEFRLDLRLSAAGRPMPADSRTNDRWFRHLAIVVRDMGEAYRRLCEAGTEMISTSPQTLPAWNKEAAGIQALYFRDPDRHPLELIHFPAGKGKPIWHAPGTTLFQGVDHTAVVVEQTRDSLHFYCDSLGLRASGFSYNHGVEQEALSGVAGASLRVTTLAGTGSCGVELLEYERPRDGRPMPADTTPDDIWWATTLLASPNGTQAGRNPERDPDGHAVTFGVESR